MSAFIDSLRVKDFRKEREKWESYDFVERGSQLMNPDSWSWKLIRLYVVLNPLKSIDRELEKLDEKKRIKEDVIDALEDMEDGMERYRDALEDYWRLKYGRSIISRVKG